MAEAGLNHLGGARFEAESAGLEPGTLNPLAVEAMQEVGIDISHQHTQSGCDVFKSGRIFAHTITVCAEASAERCPIFPGARSACTGVSPTPLPSRERGTRRWSK